MFYFEDTITQFDITESNDKPPAKDKDRSSAKPDTYSELETNDSPEALLQRIRLVM